MAGLRGWPWEGVLLCRIAWRAALDAWAAEQDEAPITKAARDFAQLGT